MLVFLRIKNLALVDDISLHFERGLHILTGETGAGKSVIMGALNLLLGQRADRGLIRSGCEECQVEALFDLSKPVPGLDRFFFDHGLDPPQDHELILRRQISLSGSNRQFINGSPAPLQVLSALGDLLVDMHGPHDHQSLLHPSHQLLILDAFARLDSDRTEFRKRMNERSEIIRQMEGLKGDPSEVARRLDLLQYQCSEIEAARIRCEEDEKLETDFKRLQNASRLMELSGRVMALLHDEEDNLLDRAGTLGRTLSELVKLDPSTSGLIEWHEQALANWQELVREIGQYSDRIDLDPEAYEAMSTRIDLLNGLKRKYGPGLKDVLAFLEASQNEVQQWEQREEGMAILLKKKEVLEKEILKVGLSLSEKRKTAIPRLNKKVVSELKDLGFRQGKFQVKMTSSKDLSELKQNTTTGLDRIEFEFAPNPGEPFMALRHIASSGEMARVMLALKTVLAAVDSIPILVFDEIDANVGGETASVVGDKLKAVAESRQVFCITHLAPVASRAGIHFRVEKISSKGRTLTKIARLEGSERVEELARMLGGKDQKVMDHAQMLQDQNTSPIAD